MTNLKLGLVRGNFSLHTEQSFNSLYEASDFSDVTLVDEDNNQIPAHKIILSSGCQFFRDLFLRNPQFQPLVFLRVSRAHLQALVTFLYKGQCQVEQWDIDSFLRLARTLKVEALTSGVEESYEEVKEAIVKTKAEMKPFANEVDEKETLKNVNQEI